MEDLATSRSKAHPKPARAAPVGTTELRGNLARFLKQARSGTPVIIKERGRKAYVLSRFEEPAAPAAFGCLRERTRYAAGAVVSARESWPAGKLP